MKHRRVSSHIVLCLAAAMALLPFVAMHPAHAAPTAPQGVYSGPVLTPDQKTKISARQDKMTQDVTALRADKKLTEKQKQAKFEDMKKDFQTDMEAILTPAQRAELQEKREMAMKIQAMDQSIVTSLTPAQKKKIQALQASIQAAGLKLRDDKKLTDAQKFAKFEVTRKNGEAQLLKVFTPTQRATYLQIQTLTATLRGPGASMASHQ